MEFLGDVAGLAFNALSGGLLGGLLRLAPEILRLFRDKADRAHEIAMSRLNIEAVREQIAGRLTSRRR